VKAMRFHEYGSPDVLRYEDADRRVALRDLPAIHAEADAGTLRGKVVITPASP